MFNHAAVADQVAACAAYAAPVQVRYTTPAGVVVGPFGVFLLEDTPEPMGIDRNRNNNEAIRVSVPRVSLGASRPRVGESFVATDGRTFRIVTEPRNPTGPVAVFRCATA